MQQRGVGVHHQGAGGSGEKLDGYTDQVRGLLQKYGDEKLSGVAPKHYAALELAGFGCKRTRDANLITGLRLRTCEFSSSQEQLDDFLQ